MDDLDLATQGKLLASISPLLFRPAFQLYLPVFLITLLTTLWIYYNLYGQNRPYLLNHQTHFPAEWKAPKPFNFQAAEILGFRDVWTTNICTGRPCIRSMINIYVQSFPKCESSRAGTMPKTRATDSPGWRRVSDGTTNISGGISSAPLPLKSIGNLWR